ncbi:unnamed protein product [Acanthoscelides obtectus]|uniref:Uncharacterized protein n=1 Tax=Acanthoscelides obtectus TaxID=200917 RepID=A0A9P0LMS1_ACAOB|nr:unnamed protein product [Acanthoscelides obtectus]CAK1649783.1 hypothetical protein AOBTE_LOCUS16431 [Acanthoscelides obtectus]
MSKRDTGWIRKHIYSKKDSKKKTCSFFVAHVIEVTKCGVCGKIIKERPAAAATLEVDWRPQNVFVRYCPVCFQARPGIQEKRTDWLPGY